MDVLNVVILTNNRAELELFAEHLQRIHPTKIQWASSFQSAQQLIMQSSIKVLVVGNLEVKTDIAGVVYEILKASPYLNVAMVSSLGPEEFHEETEGMGIFMQLAQDPGEVEAIEMLQKLQSIFKLLGSDVP